MKKPADAPGEARLVQPTRKGAQKSAQQWAWIPPRPLSETRHPTCKPPFDGMLVMDSALLHPPPAAPRAWKGVVSEMSTSCCTSFYPRLKITAPRQIWRATCITSVDTHPKPVW